jgi:RHS repeat-associated protein
MLVPNRHGVDDYRYGFQGQEKDDEIKGGKGNSLNYTFRMHDPRVGRFFAIDPLAAKYPFYSPYAFSGNRVIDAGELEGLEPTSKGKSEGEKQTAQYTPPKDAFFQDDKYQPTLDWFWHKGSDNAKSGWYSEGNYAYTQLDTKNGQVLPPMSNWEKFPMYTEGARDWHGNGVDSNGYLTGREPYADLTIMLGGLGGGKSKMAGEAIALMGGAKKAGALWTIYQGFKLEEKSGEFLLYIGKAKNGIENRYSIGKINDYAIKAFKQLEMIPDNGTALGVEQLIMELNGWKGKASNTVKPVLSNINNATVKEIYTTQGKNWLNANVEGWEKLFKID